jgi:pimeloyl-ACP methyl ester carboxylesterase
LAAIFRASATWTVAERWPDDLATLSVPTHVLGLEGDSSHPIAVAREMARILPRARLWARVPSLDAQAMARQWARVADSPI